ncbi:MAG: HAD-IIA family hydrolase [Acidimicrobiia bacterium]
MGNWVLDLDGVLWLSDQPIAGSSKAVEALLAQGDEVLFVTNNSNPTIAEQEANLARHGVDGRGRVVSSAAAAATLVEAGEQVLLCGGDGAREALAARGAHVLDGRRDPDGPVDAVVVGFHRWYDYEVMRRAATAVHRGARLVATNDDATYPTALGLIPGSGSILAGIETAAGVKATVAGKPFAPMAALVRSRLQGQGTVVGDRPDTDGRLAVALGYRFALVLSGVTADAADADPPPDLVADDLASLVARATS